MTPPRHCATVSLMLGWRSAKQPSRPINEQPAAAWSPLQGGTKVTKQQQELVRTPAKQPSRLTTRVYANPSRGLADRVLLAVMSRLNRT